MLIKQTSFSSAEFANKKRLTAVVIVLSGPPHKLVIATGPAGGYFERTAQLYAKQLEKSGE